MYTSKEVPGEKKGRHEKKIILSLSSVDKRKETADATNVTNFVALVFRLLLLPRLASCPTVNSSTEQEKETSTDKPQRDWKGKREARNSLPPSLDWLPDPGSILQTFLAVVSTLTLQGNCEGDFFQSGRRDKKSKGKKLSPPCRQGEWGRKKKMSLLVSDR